MALKTLAIIERMRIRHLAVLLALFLSCLPAAFGQTKKVLVFHYGPERIAEWQKGLDGIRLVSVNDQTALKEAADADASIGEVSPELMHAAPAPEVGADPERGRGARPVSGVDS